LKLAINNLSKYSGEQYAAHASFWEERMRLLKPYEITGFGALRNERSIIKHQFTLDAGAAQVLSSLAGNRAMDQLSVYMSVVFILTRAYSTTDHWLVHTPALESAEGQSLNASLPIDITLNKGASVKDLILAMASRLSGVFHYQDFPITLFHQPEQFASNVMVMMRGLQSNIRFTLDQYDIYFVFDKCELGSLPSVSILYNGSMFYQWLIEQFGIIFNRLLNQFKKSSVTLEQITLSDIPSQPAIDRNYDQSVLDIFRQRATDHPGNTFLVTVKETLTYGDVLRRSTALANRLLNEFNIRREEPIIVSLPKSPDAIVAMFGIMIAGGTYVPIDISLPVDRRKFVFEDTKARIFVTDTNLLNALNGVEVTLILMDQEIDENLLLISPIKLPPPHQLSYIIYTSGSTGNPKGVMLEYGGLLTASMFYCRLFNVSSSDRLMLFFALHFDGSILDIFTTVCAGAALVLPSDRIIKNSKEFVALMRDTRSSIFVCTPSYLSFLGQQRFDDLRILVTAGESALASDLQYYAKYCRVFNAYGPTEATVCSTIYEITSDDRTQSISIGSAIDGKILSVIDDNGRTLPPGFVGELAIGGEGIARGYLNADKLTSVKFKDIGSARMYLSGDFVRRDPNGIFFFIGRTDGQVKIRGFRIELNEIRNSLLSLDGITKAAVITKDPANPFIVAFYVTQKDISVRSIRTYLSARLPHYMVPEVFVKLDDLTLTTSGKVDLQALSLIELTNTVSEAFIAPENDIQFRIANIWSSVLGIENISIDSNFFEVGGHSLNLAKVFAAMQEAGMSIDIDQFFENPTIESIARSTHLENRPVDIKILPAPLAPDYPVSLYQEGILLRQSLHRDSYQFNSSSAHRIHGELDILKLEQCFVKLIERHEVLRTYFVEIDGEFRQKKADSTIQFKITVQNLVLGQSLQEVLTIDARTPFELREPLLLRTRLIPLQDGTNVFQLTTHHLICDGLSTLTIMRELASLYIAKTEGFDIDLEPLEFQYIDYCSLRNNNHFIEQVESSRDFWADLLSKAIPPTSLPESRALAPGVQQLTMSKVSHKTGQGAAMAITSFAKDTGRSEFEVFLYCLFALLHKYTGQSEMMIGTAVSTRPGSSTYNHVGHYVNFLPLTCRVDPAQSFESFADELDVATRRMIANGKYPYSRMVEEFSDEGRSFFSTGIVFQTDYNEVTTFGGMNIEPVDIEEHGGELDLRIAIYRGEDGFCIDGYFKSALYSYQQVDRFIAHFRNIMGSCLSNPSTSIKDLQYFDEQEKGMIQRFGLSIDKPQQDLSLFGRFQQQVRKTPLHTAIVEGNHDITYSGLEAKALLFARYLKDKANVKTEDVVLLLLPKSEWTVTSILSLWSLGAAYVPIDLSLPKNRVETIIDDCRPKHVITTTASIESVGVVFKDNVTVINLDSYLPGGQTFGYVDIACTLPAYVIYTSGSTGKPKGVVVAHQGVLEMAESLITMFNIDQSDRVMPFASLSFDVSVSDLLTALFSGATFVIVDKNVLMNTSDVSRWMSENGITVASMPPSYLHLLNPQEFRFLKVMMSAGEPATSRTLQFANYCNYFNGYGPTECSVISTLYKCESHENLFNIPIGKPIGASNASVVDEYFQPVGIGVPGQLVFTGRSLALGYLYDETQTAAKFIQLDGKRTYLTGDYVRWLENGDIQFIGRKDAMVKVRGNRIDLFDVRTAVLSNPNITDAAIVAEGNHINENILALYYVSESALTMSEFRTCLKAILPVFMIPTKVVRVSRIPLNNSGKIDYASLSHYAIADHSKVFVVKTLTTTERRVLEIWREVLGVENAGINDSFYDLGGESLNAARIIARLKADLNCYVSFEDFFRHNTISSLCKQMNIKSHVSLPPIIPVAVKDHYQASFSQLQFWLFEQRTSSQKANIIVSKVRLEGNVDIDRLASSFETLVKHNEILRTFFKMVDEKLMQRIQQIEEFRGFVKVVSQIDPEELQESFDLEHGPLIRCFIQPVSKDNTIVVLQMHHIISDGLTIHSLVEQLADIYSSPEENSPKQQLAYHDYTEWHNTLLNDGKLEGMLNYWIEKLSPHNSFAMIPPDDVSSRTITEIPVENFVIDNEDLTSLKELSRQLNVGLYSMLLSCYQLICHYLGKQDTVIVGTPAGGRPLRELENMVGLFMQTLPVCTVIDRSETLPSMFRRVETLSREALDHQLMPLDYVLGKLKWTKSHSGSTIRTGFTWVEDNSKLLESFFNRTGLRVHDMHDNFTGIKTDLWMHAGEKRDQVEIVITYDPTLYNPAKIKFIGKAMQLLAKDPVGLGTISECLSTLMELQANLAEEHKRNFIRKNVKLFNSNQTIVEAND
jgi:amino acid adenylation domain-containing protein